jgi:hypothetical protein
MSSLSLQKCCQKFLHRLPKTLLEAAGRAPTEGPNFLLMRRSAGRRLVSRKIIRLGLRLRENRIRRDEFVDRSFGRNHS